MERLRNMSLKQTFFLLTFGCLFVSLIFVAVCWIVCDVIVGTIPNGGMSIDFSGAVTILEQPSPEQARTLSILRNIQIISCVLFPVLGLGAAGTVFYQWKLKRPNIYHFVGIIFCKCICHLACNLTCYTT